MTDEQSAAAAAFSRQRAAMAVEGLTTPEKAVLLVLAIMANADGVAWPSITQLAARASIGRRTAFEALDRLEALKLIQRKAVPGKGARYTFPTDWCATRTSAPTAPVRQPHLTGAPPAPKQPENNHRKKKASPSPSTRAVAVDPYPMPDGTDPQAWSDFLANRKRKRLTNTATAHKSLMDDLARHATDAWPPARLIAYAAGKGWGSVRNPERPDDARRFDRARPDALAGPRRGYAADMLAAAHARPPDGSEGDPQDSGGTQGEVPAWLRQRP